MIEKITVGIEVTLAAPTLSDAVEALTSRVLECPGEPQIESVTVNGDEWPPLRRRPSLMKDKVLMLCGHAANARHNGRPACAICAGLDPGWDEINPVQPDLEGRMAECASCGETTESSLLLAYFEYRPGRETDEYYCGCRGWE